MATQGYSRTQVKHSAMIADLCERHPDMQTTGFWSAMEALAQDLDWWDPIRRCQFTPDAFRIDRERQVIELHEVVNTHYPKRTTLLAMGEFWGDWDSEGGPDDEWLPRLFIHHEASLEPAEIDLCHWYWEGIAQMAARPAA